MSGIWLFLIGVGVGVLIAAIFVAIMIATDPDCGRI